MSELLRWTLAGLRSGDSEAVLTAASFFEAARGVRPDFLDPPVPSQPAGEAELHQLEDVLIEFAHGGGPGAGAAAWALGKRADPRLVEPLRTAVRVGLVQQDNDLVYQALIALQNSGERAFGDETEHSVFAVERNRQAAERYLAVRAPAEQGVAADSARTPTS